MILVTGAAGCVGSALVTALVADGTRIAALRLPSTPVPPHLEPFADRIDWRIGDVRNPESLRAAFLHVTRVYHVAGISVSLERLRDQMMDVNVRGTTTLAQVALAHGIERLVYTSSSSTIGIPDDGTIANEEFAYNGGRFTFSYMHSKRIAEQILLDYAGRGLPVVVVNPTGVMAPGGDLRANWCGLVDMLARKRLPLVPPGGVAIVTARDMAHGHLRAMEVGRVGERYILNTANVTYRDLIELAAEVVSTAPPRLMAPRALLRVAGAANSLLNMLRGDPMSCSLLTWEHAALLNRRIYYDQSKAVRELGLSQTSLREAIEDVHAWWLTTRAGRSPGRQPTPGRPAPTTTASSTGR
jgi:dihydroflavonol-4-reductase